MAAVKKLIRFFSSPDRMFFGSFLFMIAVGTILLKLPISTQNGHINTIDALFTATSAVCVTGLTTVDTGSFFSPFGHGVILFLIQTGGLGIITFSTLIYYFLGLDVSLKSKLALETTFTHGPVRNIYSIIKSVFIYTFIIEFIGMTLLFAGWLRHCPPSRALSLAVFHSISAFCNAGFSLFRTSLTDFRGDWIINTVVICLIVLGGMGFIVFYELEQKATRKKRLSLHTKVVLVTTLVLIASAAIIILAAEWNNAFFGFSTGDKVLSSLFQSVTARTAGFNTIDTASFSNTSLFLLIIMMFIGASPGSCGGGIKTTNLAILVSLTFNRFRGSINAIMFKRTIPQDMVFRSISIVVGSISFLTITLFLFLFFEEKALSQIIQKNFFIESLFEITSAFGTVGLSTGLTPLLDVSGKLLLIATMFTGRVGLLTLAYALSKRSGTVRYRYGEENIIIG